MILGISASGRSDGVASEAVLAVLKASGEEYEYVSLADKQINGCTGCPACAAGNVCKVVVGKETVSKYRKYFDPRYWLKRKNSEMYRTR